MGRLIIANQQEADTVVELPFQDTNTPPVSRDLKRAIAHVQAMHMRIPSIYSVYSKPSISSLGWFVLLNAEEFQDVLENSRLYLVNQTRRPTLSRRPPRPLTRR